MNLFEIICKVFENKIEVKNKCKRLYVISGPYSHCGSLMWGGTNCVFIAEYITKSDAVIKYCNCIMFGNENEIEACKHMCKLLNMDFSTIELKIKDVLIENKLNKISEDFK